MYGKQTAVTAQQAYESSRRNGGAGSVLTQEQFTKAFNTGRSSKDARIQNSAARQRGEGKVYFGQDVDYGGERYKAASEDMVSSAELDVIKTLAKVTGTDVVFYQSEADMSGRYKGANGFMRNGTMYLDVNAGANRTSEESAVLLTAAHELTHYIRENNAEGYAQLRDFVTRHLIEDGVDIEALAEQKAARENGLLSMDEAVEEVIADSCEMMLEDTQLPELMAKENPGLYEQIREWIANFAEKLRKAFTGVEARHAEAKAMMQYADELSRIWDSALAGAVRNTEAASGTETASGNAKYSTRESFADYTNGKQLIKSAKDRDRVCSAVEKKLSEMVSRGSIEDFDVDKSHGMGSYETFYIKVEFNEDADGYGNSMEIRFSGHDQQYGGADVYMYDGGYAGVKELTAAVEKEIKRFAEENGIPYGNTEAATDAGKTKYSLREYEVETALYDALDHADTGYDNVIKVGQMPQFVRELTGIDGDFYIYRNHMYSNIKTEKEAKAEGRYKKGEHYHGVGLERMTDAIMAIENPVLTINDTRTKGNPEITMVLPVTGENGTPLYAALGFYTPQNINGSMTRRPHIVLSIYERLEGMIEGGKEYKDLATVIDEAAKENRVLSYDKEMRDVLPVTAQLSTLGSITETSLKQNVSQFQKEVKSFKEKNKINYSMRDVAADDTADERRGRQESYAELRRQNEELRRRTEYWKGQTRTTKEATVRKADTDKLARRLTEELHNKDAEDTVKEELKRMGDYIVQTDGQELSYAELKDWASAIADHILSGSEAEIESGMEDARRELLDYLKSNKLKINEREMLDLPEGWKREHRRIRFGKDGLPIDTAWMELQEKFGEGAFPSTITSQSDMLFHIADMERAWQPVRGNPFENYMGEMRETVAQDILDTMLSDEIRQTAKTAADRARDRMNKAVAEERTRYNDMKSRMQERIQQVYQEGVARKQEAVAKEKAAFGFWVRNQRKMKKLCAFNEARAESFLQTYSSNTTVGEPINSRRNSISQPGTESNAGFSMFAHQNRVFFVFSQRKPPLNKTRRPQGLRVISSYSSRFHVIALITRLTDREALAGKYAVFAHIIKQLVTAYAAVYEAYSVVLLCKLPHGVLTVYVIHSYSRMRCNIPIYKALQHLCFKSVNEKAAASRSAHIIHFSAAASRKLRFQSAQQIIDIRIEEHTVYRLKVHALVMYVYKLSQSILCFRGAYERRRSLCRGERMVAVSHGKKHPLPLFPAFLRKRRESGEYAPLLILGNEPAAKVPAAEHKVKIIELRELRRVYAFYYLPALIVHEDHDMRQLQRSIPADIDARRYA